MKSEMTELKLTVNGKPYELKVKPKTLLVELLRNELKLTGTKVGCLDSACGACTVNIDGKAVRSCSILAIQANGHEVTTIEGVADAGRPRELRMQQPASTQRAKPSRCRRRNLRRPAPVVRRTRRRPWPHRSGLPATARALTSCAAPAPTRPQRRPGACH